MTLDEKIAMVKALSDETEEEVVSAFLTLAGKVMYRYVQVDLAAYKLNKRGWDYETRHVENGVTREFEAGDVPPSIRNRITPICSPVKARETL